MNRRQHIKRHKKLHGALDELLADFVAQTGSVISQTSVFDLLEWSYKQTINPIEDKISKKGDLKDEAETTRRSDSGESVTGG